MTAGLAARIDLPRDPGLPRLPHLLDPEMASDLLATPLAGAIVARIREIDYDPGHRLMVRYRTDDGRCAAATLDRDGDGRDLLSAWAWPGDPALPALARSSGTLRLMLASLDLASPCDTVTRLAYRPGTRAVLGIGPVVVKAYATRRAHAAAARGLARSSAFPLRCPASVADLPAILATVQTRLDGDDVGPREALEVAREAGYLAGMLHSEAVDGEPALTPAAIALRALRPARTVAVALPHLRERVAALTRALTELTPASSGDVLSHGDFAVDQLRATARGLALTDFDTICRAPAALDLATFAANLVSGRPGDEERAVAVLDALVEGYGRRPADLSWHLAAALLRRVDRPLRRAKRDWVARCEALVEVAEGAVHVAAEMAGRAPAGAAR